MMFWQCLLLGEEIVKCLQAGIPVLFPYDADANHGPCLKNGRKAHWALIKGKQESTNKRYIYVSGDFSLNDCTKEDADIKKKKSCKVY